MIIYISPNREVETVLLVKRLLKSINRQIFFILILLFCLNSFSYTELNIINEETTYCENMNANGNTILNPDILFKPVPDTSPEDVTSPENNTNQDSNLSLKDNIDVSYSSHQAKISEDKFPTTNNQDWFFLSLETTDFEIQNTNHYQFYSDYVTGYNRFILKAIDLVQSTAMDGGGYFIGKYADPPESPIGYELSLFNYPIIDPPRTTSFCTGATYATFIEAMNEIYDGTPVFLSSERMDALRMQEFDGSRRDDFCKFWGYWNAPAGNVLSLTRYSEVGTEITPRDARPGDFVFIQNKNGTGHLVVFLHYFFDEDMEIHMKYWSSQNRTDGMGDASSEWENIDYIKVVRLTNPIDIFLFDYEVDLTDEVILASIF